MKSATCHPHRYRTPHTPASAYSNCRFQRSDDSIYRRAVHPPLSPRLIPHLPQSQALTHPETLSHADSQTEATSEVRLTLPPSHCSDNLSLRSKTAEMHFPHFAESRPRRKFERRPPFPLALCCAERFVSQPFRFCRKTEAGESRCCPDDSDRFQIRAVSPAHARWDYRAGPIRVSRNTLNVLRFPDPLPEDSSPKSDFPKDRYRSHSEADESPQSLEYFSRLLEFRHSPWSFRIPAKFSPCSLRVLPDSCRPRYEPKYSQKSLPQTPGPIRRPLECVPR